MYFWQDSAKYNTKQGIVPLHIILKDKLSGVNLKKKSDIQENTNATLMFLSLGMEHSNIVLMYINVDI
jgi:hypothetical protein